MEQKFLHTYAHTHTHRQGAAALKKVGGMREEGGKKMVVERCFFLFATLSAGSIVRWGRETSVRMHLGRSIVRKVQKTAGRSIFKKRK